MAGKVLRITVNPSPHSHQKKTLQNWVSLQEKLSVRMAEQAIESLKLFTEAYPC
jgi:hypothetical protein